MRRALIVTAALVALVVIALIGALTLVPDSVYRNEITKAAKSATGRELVIEGDIGITLYPVLGVTAEGVTLSNAPGFTAPQFARMEALDAGVKLWPLLSGKVEIARFVLVRPDIALEVDAKGNNNWTFETAEEPRTEAEEIEEAAREEEAALPEVSIGTLRLQDGRVSYANKQSGGEWEASDINLSVELAHLDEPLKVDGDARFKGERVAVGFNADKPRALLDGAPSPVSLDVKSDLLKLSFEGEAAAGEALALTGPLDLSTPSLRRLLSWLSEPPSGSGGEGKTLGAFALKGALAHKGDVSRIDDASLSLDGMKAKGKLALNTAPARPFIDATLAVDRLDLDSYLGGSGAASTKKSGSAGGGAGGAAEAGAGARAASGGWSGERMDLSGLKAADADLALTADKVFFGGMTLSDATLAARLRNGVLTADLSKLKLYGGKGAVKVTLDASGATPSLASDLAFSGIALEPFLRDTAAYTDLSGTGALALTTTSRGKSERAMVQSLNGKGTLKVANGTLRGVDLTAMMRDILKVISPLTGVGAFKGDYQGDAVGGAKKTEFSELGGSFAIQSGVLSNNDLSLISPNLRLKGAGTANIVERTLDYRLMPQYVETREGGVEETGSLSVRVVGSWDNPRYVPDTEALVGGALKGAIEAVGAGQDPLKGALEGLFGRPGAKPVPQEGDAAGPSGTTEGTDGTQGTTGGEGSWATGGTSSTEPAPAQEGAATQEEKPPPTPEEQIQDIFQDIFGPKPEE